MFGLDQCAQYHRHGSEAVDERGTSDRFGQRDTGLRE